jgi:hypothetical protein
MRPHRSAGPPDAPVTRTPSLRELERPGPARARALAAGAAALRTETGLCGDRGRAVAQRTLDAALEAARRQA